MPCYFPLHLRFDPVKKQTSFGRPIEGSKGIVVRVPCGQCIGCRLERSRKWALRCVSEAKMHAHSCFITLTYSPEFLPENGTLVKRDLQLFFKRLRKAYPENKLRYFACGEYGEKFARPHYHVILFGLDFSEKKIKLDKNPLDLKGDIRYSDFSQFERNAVVTRSKTLEKIWGLGLVAVGACSFESCAYVARYCLKKVTGKNADEHYGNRLPEFLLSSRRPGIGGDYCDKYLNDIYPLDRCFSRGRPCKPPRYFDKILEKVDRRLFLDIRQQRMHALENANPLHDSDLERMEEFAKLRQKNLRNFEKNS